jgi:hypothetical protein
MDAVSGINSLLERAYHLFDVYQDRFDRPPTIGHIRDIKQLPVLNVFEVLKQVDYTKVHLLKDVQRNTPRTFFNLYDNVFPGLITDEEYNCMKNVVYSILGNVNITADDNILIISDEDRSYLTLDFANMLLEEKYNVFVVFATRMNNVKDIQDIIRKTEINVVFDFTQAGLVRSLDAASLKKIVFINRNLSILKRNVQCYSLYHVSKIGFIGITDITGGRFYYPTGDFFIEMDDSNNIMVTCLFRKLFPLIRYLTFDKGYYARGRLCIGSYMGVIDEQPVSV